MKTKQLLGIFAVCSFFCFSNCSEYFDIREWDSTNHGNGGQEVIKAAVLRSAGNNYPDFWKHLNENWELYGEKKVEIDYWSYDYTGLTYDDIVASGADVIIMDDARNPLEMETHTEMEIGAIINYVSENHGLIVTGGTLRPHQHRQLVSFLGFGAEAAGQVYFGEPTADSINIRNQVHPFFKNMLGYTTSSKNFYSGSDWNRDGKDGYPDDWESILEGREMVITGYIWNTNHMTNRLECSPITFYQHQSYRAAFAGHAPANGFPTQDDFQFYYNMIVRLGIPENS